MTRGNENIVAIGCNESFVVPSKAYWNCTDTELVEHAITRREGQLGPGGILLVKTGKHTGRSPRDKYVVKSNRSFGNIWWENNQNMSGNSFDLLFQDVKRHIQSQEMFIQDLHARKGTQGMLNVRMINSLAWHSLFIRNLLIPIEDKSRESSEPDLVIINCPEYKAKQDVHGTRSETVIAINLEKRLIIICGTAYGGENKKSVFTYLNYILPDLKTLPMHCSANHTAGNPDSTALFFGLSGTGKTTLSADPDRVLIGDDEHGWSDDGIFNIEGGCYAKTLGLDPEKEADIYATTTRFGTVIENMVYDPVTRALDYSDSTLTENMRCAYNIDQISFASSTGVGGHPRNLFMLTCDAFGVLPPIARLCPDQALYHFLSGFTSKVAGTESGINEPVPVFSTCYGSPFLPRPPKIYGELLHERINMHNTRCWLVNTGWSGGGYGTGIRTPLKYTRGLLTAALNGKLDDGKFSCDPVFGFDIPHSVRGIPSNILHPKEGWNSTYEYDEAASKLSSMFAENFRKISQDIDCIHTSAIPDNLQ